MAKKPTEARRKRNSSDPPRVLWSMSRSGGVSGFLGRDCDRPSVL
jgi:hypothetical protein